MSNSVSNLDLASNSQAGKEITYNNVINALSPGALFGLRVSTTAGLTWGYYGGNVKNLTTNYPIANGTILLAASTTNYIQCSDTGVISVNATGFTTNPLYSVVTGASSITSYTDFRSFLRLGSSGGGSSLEIKDEGISLTTATTSLNFVGAGVTATVVGNVVTVTVPGGGGTPFATDINVNLLTVGRGNNNDGLSTAFGRNVLLSTTTATSNTGVGTFAAQALTTGSNNCLIGFASGASLTTGGQNSAFGFGSLQSNISGAANTAVGHNCLNSTANSNNCAVGTNAYKLASGGNNTGIGSGVGANTSTGVNNTFIGLDAAFSNTTGNNNICIGANSDKSAAAVSNEITLGNAAITVLRAQVTSITALSDRRDKKDIKELSFGLDFIKSLKPVSFTWNTRDGKKVDIKSAGFIAQDLKEAQEAFNASETLNLVYESNPEKLEANYGHLIPVLVKAIQDLKSELDELRLTIKV